MARAPRTRPRRRRLTGRRDPHFFTEAGPVTIRRPDGTTTSGRALTEEEHQLVVRVRGRVSPALRARIERRDRVCRYCGDAAGPFEVDHVVPIALGGSNRMRNLVLACQRCNTEKGASVWKPRPRRQPSSSTRMHDGAVSAPEPAAG